MDAGVLPALPLVTGDRCAVRESGGDFHDAEAWDGGTSHLAVAAVGDARPPSWPVWLAAVMSPSTARGGVGTPRLSTGEAEASEWQGVLAGDCVASSWCMAPVPAAHSSTCRAQIGLEGRRAPVQVSACASPASPFG